MRVLVTTYHPWRTDLSTGNTLANLFNGMQGQLEFAQIFFREGTPSNAFGDTCFAISERELAKSIITRKPVGTVFHVDQCHVSSSPNEGLSFAYNAARQLRWDSLLLVQDCIGALGKWRSNRLYKFVEEFEPDILFSPSTRAPVINALLVDLAKRYSLPLFLYAWDDIFTLDKKRLSPFYRMRMALERKGIAKSADYASTIYTITPELGELCKRDFGKDYKVVRKGYRFDNRPDYTAHAGTIRMLYAGNIGAQRWRVLAELVKALNIIGPTAFRLDIFTHNAVSAKMREALNSRCSELHPGVPANCLPALFDQCDVLVHVEATDEAERERCRYSFSTKIVDYLHAGRCVLSVGGPTTATNYLRDNDAAIVVNEMTALPEVLRDIASDRKLLAAYARKSWNCGKANHDIRQMQSVILGDFRDAASMEKPTCANKGDTNDHLLK
ncbi:hypothetical protein H6A33_10455 [Collinsella tanakaei]|nr:hypothetical protein [Collinsella tanakaei]